jgi:hypothetical protein
LEQLIREDTAAPRKEGLERKCWTVDRFGEAVIRQEKKEGKERDDRLVQTHDRSTG